MSIADSGASSHFVTINAPIVNKTIVKQPLAITTAGGAVIYSIHTGDLDLPYLPPAARRCHVVPSLGKFSLFRIGQLCDANCEVTVSKEKLTVNFGNTVIIQGQRVRSTGLWHIDLVNHDGPQNCATVPMSAVAPTTKTPKGNNSPNTPSVPFYGAPNHPGTEPPTCLTGIGTARPADVVAFHHAALFSPALSTLEVALQKGFLPPLPGCTLSALQRHPPQSSATIKGHMDQIRKNLRSTKKESKSIEPTSAPDHEITNDWHPTSDPSNKRTNHCYVALIKPERSGQIHSDLTGRFPIASSNGNTYLLIVYDYDC
jgi:hypothetical protein